MTTAARRSGLCLAALAATASLMLSACGGPTRSVAAYCSYFYGQGSALRNRWIQADKSTGQSPFGELSSIFSALPEAAGFLHELSLRAPEDIAPDVQILAEALKHVSEQEGSAATDPLGALAGGLVDGLETSGPEQQVNEYTEQHCHPPSPPSGAASEPNPPAHAEP